MNATEFSLNAKLGLLNAKPSRPISNKGTISDIRKRTEASLRPPGFRTYGNLGSQNAITTGQSAPSNEARLVIDIETPKSNEATFVKPEATETSFNSEKAKDIKADSIKPPKPFPPFNLDSEQGKKDMEEWSKYMEIKYWRLVDTDEDPFNLFYADSLGYTQFLRARTKMLKRMIKYYEDHPSEKFFEGALSILVPLGQMGVDFIAEQVKQMAKFGATIPTAVPASKGDIAKAGDNIPKAVAVKDNPAVKQMQDAKKFLESIYPVDMAINQLRDFIKSVLPQKATSYREMTFAMINAVLNAHPTWKAKLRKEHDKQMQEFFEEITQIANRI
jgi:hypothetical protein